MKVIELILNWFHPPPQPADPYNPYDGLWLWTPLNTSRLPTPAAALPEAVLCWGWTRGGAGVAPAAVCPLPPASSACAAAPALNGGSPSGGEPQIRRGAPERRQPKTRHFERLPLGQSHPGKGWGIVGKERDGAAELGRAGGFGADQQSAQVRRVHKGRNCPTGSNFSLRIKVFHVMSRCFFCSLYFNLRNCRWSTLPQTAEHFFSSFSCSYFQELKLATSYLPTATCLNSPYLVCVTVLIYGV